MDERSADHLSRARFMSAAAALGGALAPIAAGAQPLQPQAQQSPELGLPHALKRSLVLSGGGALGAYEAGVVQSIVARQGLVEGQPLPDYGVVCGTSIGALNAYLVATAQWQSLSNIWSTIASQNVIRLKPQFAKLTDSSSGVINRFAQAIGLAIGVFGDVSGVIDGEHLQQWLEQYLDLSRPIVTPLVFVTTNISRQAPEYFYLLPDGFDETKKRFALSAVRKAIGPFIQVTEAGTGSLRVRQLRASCAIPLAFDPVVLPTADGKTAQYVDGGVSANTPILVARALSAAVDSVLLGPPFQGASYKNALGATGASFETMQRIMMFDAARTAYLETMLLRAYATLPPETAARLAQSRGVDPSEMQAFVNLLSDTEFYVVRPEKALPVSVFGFDDGKALGDTYDIGVADGKAGFKKLDIELLR